MSENDQNESKAIDPDVWTVLSLLVSTVSMVAQLAGLKTGKTPKGIAAHSTSMAYEKLCDELESAIRNAEKLIKILSNASGEGAAGVLAGPFKFGQSRAYMTATDLQRYA